MFTMMRTNVFMYVNRHTYVNVYKIERVLTLEEVEEKWL